MEELNPSQSCDFYDVPCHLGNLFDWYKELWFWVWGKILDVGLSVLSYIPVPDWMTNIGTFQLPDGVLWFINALQLPTGVTIVVASLVIRFGIRRLPFIG